MKIIFVLLLISSHFVWGHSPSTSKYIDLNRYVGRWYTISSFPQPYTRNCQGQLADYSLANDKTMKVTNTCLKKNGKKVIQGKAVILNQKTNAELEVTFDTFFTKLLGKKGDYQIIKIDRDYNYVMVGSKDRNTLWIMSRTTRIPNSIYRDYVSYAKQLQFPVEKLIFSYY